MKHAKVEDVEDYTLHLAKHMTLEKYKKDNTFGVLPDPI